MRTKNSRLIVLRLQLASRVKPRNGDAIARHETVSRLTSNRAMAATPLRGEHTYYKQKCMKRIAS